MVQILAACTSNSAPNLSVFTDFDFQIVLARMNFEKMLPHPQLLTILTSKSLSRAGVVQIF